MAQYDPYAHFAGASMHLFFAERQKALKKGYTLSHDLEHHTPEELIRVGACYVDFGTTELEGASQDNPHPFYPEGTSIPWKNLGDPIKMICRGLAFIEAGLDLRLLIERIEADGQKESASDTGE